MDSEIKESIHFSVEAFAERIERQVSSLLTSVAKMEKALMGNGQKGLISDVNILMVHKERMEKFMEAMSAARIRIGTTVVASVLSAGILAWAIAAFAYWSMEK